MLKRQTIAVFNLEYGEKIVGAGLVPARVAVKKDGQGQALPLQLRSTPNVHLKTTLNPRYSLMAYT